MPNYKRVNPKPASESLDRAVRTYLSALTGHTHALSDLTISGASANQVPAWSGSAWVPVTPAGITTTDNNTLTVFYPVFSTSAQANAPFYVDTTVGAGRFSYVPSSGQLTVGSLQSSGIVAGSSFNHVAVTNSNTSNLATVAMQGGKTLTCNSNLTFSHSASAANIVAVSFGATSGTVALTGHTHALADLVTTGSAGATNFLRGDGAWTTGILVSDGDKGDITISSSGTVWNIDAATVGLTELSATGTPSASTYLRGDNTWATVSGLSDGDKGDITVSVDGTVWEIDAGVVTTTELGGDITAAGKALLDDADAAAQRTTLGLGALATLANAPAGTLTGTTLASGVTDSSLTSVGTLAALTVTATIAGSVNGNAATVTTNANLTGHITSTGNATLLGAFTSLQLRAALSDETGSGAAVFANTPTLVTPILGTPASGNLSNCTNLPTHTHALSNLTVSGATANQVPVWTGFSWVPRTPAPVSDGDKGDIIVSSGGTVWNIDADTVGLAELSAAGTPSGANFLRGDNTWATQSAVLADADYGDITVSSSGTVWSIDAATVGLAELSASGTASASTFLRGDNTWAAASGSVSDADYGDIIVSSSGTVWSIDANTVGLTELSATGTPDATTFLRGDNTWAAASGSVSDADYGDIIVSSSGTVWNINAATVGLAELSASGTASSSTFLRGDNTWSAITFGDGSAAAPSVTHTGDTDTGMYFDVAGDKIYLATAGTLAATINATQGVTFASTLQANGNFTSLGDTTTTGINYVAVGTAALPSITRSADPNTGIWFATDNVSVTTAGVNALTIGSTQNAAFAADVTATGAITAKHGMFLPAVGGFTGWFDHPASNGIATTTSQLTAASTSYAIPYVPQKTINISAIGAFTAASVASATCSLAIYASGADGWPSGDAAMHCSATLTASLATTAISSLYNATLYAGTQYWLVYNTPVLNFPSMRAHGASALPKIFKSGTNAAGDAYIAWSQPIATSRNFTTSPVTNAIIHGNLAVPIVYVTIA